MHMSMFWKLTDARKTLPNEISHQPILSRAYTSFYINQAIRDKPNPRFSLIKRRSQTASFLVVEKIHEMNIIRMTMRSWDLTFY